MRTATRVGALGATAALSLVLAACGGSDTASMDHSMSSPSSTSSPSTSASVDAAHADQDVVFAQQMTAHHQGAIEMAELATSRASGQEVKTLSASIQSAQRTEVVEMTSWLEAWGEPVSADSAMAGTHHSSMPGTMSEEQTTRLKGATGADFDRMFLQLMIEHHRGAVAMAETQQQRGRNPRAVEVAGSIGRSQNAEIDRMNQLLDATG